MAKPKMDFDKYLKTVTNLNKYISFTWDIQNKRIDLNIPFNISTILSLKDLRSTEIEYFNKCEENGGATKIVELLLRSPPSKTWGLLGGELINLLQYWLEAIIKHLIIHNIHWWTFLKLILKFIKVISSKDVSLNKVLIEETARCLLDLATHSTPGAQQRTEILKTFNAISAEASRSIRFAYKDRFQDYFTRLSAQLPTSGDLLLQHSILEALLRWLQPRHDATVRRAAAERWFADGRTSRAAVDVFMGRSWQNFIKDARDFLNALNESSDLVTSVVCRSFSIGQRVYLSGKDNCWLDVNTSTKSVTILLDPRWEEVGGGASDAVVVCEDNVVHVELYQQSQQVLISAAVIEMSHVCPWAGDVAGTHGCDLRIGIAVSTRSDLYRLDRALRGIFGDKYKTSLDISNVARWLSPDARLSNSDVINGTEEDTKFSMPPEVPRRKHSGYIVRPRNLGLWNSPSTISTSSLAQLHEKLAALPQYTFDKQPVSVCALPQLSTVSEVTENDENQTLNSSVSTIRYRRYGVSSKRINKNETKTSQSTSDESNEKRNLSPVVNSEENSVSCLLLATVGSTDNSIISDAIARLPKNVPCNTDNIVDLLAREALEGHTAKQDCGVNIGSNLKSPQGHQNNPVPEVNPITAFLKENPLPNKVVIDESSNEIVENTPMSCIQVKRPKYKSKRNPSKSNTVNKEADGVPLIHNVEVVENFFSQHVAENRNGDIVISPTLARKINETSSECSDDFDQGIFIEEQPHNYNVQDIAVEPYFIPDIDIVDCLNAMVDKVCQDLDKCVTYIDSVDGGKEIDNTIGNKCGRRTRSRAMVNKVKDVQDAQQSNAKVNLSKPKPKPSNVIKLKFPKSKSLSLKKTSKQINKPKKGKPFTIMSPIIERESVSDEPVTKNVESVITESPKRDGTALLRRKRKLYSPKDETCHERANINEIETVEDDKTTNTESKECCKTPKSIATSYKELEQERVKRIRKSRNRLSLRKPEPSVTPRTMKNNRIFDSLKDVVDGEPVKLADKAQLKNEMVVYNFTSDSEDEEEKKGKSKPVSKKMPSAAANSKNVTLKESTKINDTAEKTEEGNKKGAKRVRKPRAKKAVQKHHNKSVTKIPEPPKYNLEDERMRTEAPEILNTSFIIENAKDLEKSPDKPPEPILNVAHEMECIIENNSKSNDQNVKEKQQKTKSKRALSLKRNKVIPMINLDLTMADHDGTVSPLPGLVVETVLSTELDNDSLNANMLQRFKDIFQGKASSEVNTTQNLLSDTHDLIDNSASNWNITEELNREDNKKQNESYNKGVEKKTTKKTNIKKSVIRKIKSEFNVQEKKSHTKTEPDIIELSVTEDNSEKSMATMGSSHSPITAHGDFDENPPNSTLLNENIPPRIVEEEYLNQSIKDFFTKLTEQLNVSDREDNPVESVKSSSNRLITRQSSKDGNISTAGRASVKSGRSGSSISPVVALTRLSPEFIRSRMSVDSSISPVVALTRLSPEFIRSRMSVDSSEVNIVNSKTNLNVNSPKTYKDNLENSKDDCSLEEADKPTKEDTVIRSTISPINLGGDFKLRKAKKIPSRSGSEDNCVKRIKNIFSNRKQSTIQTITTTAELNNPKSSSRKSLRNIATSSPISRKQSTAEDERDKSVNSRDLDDSSKTLKRKSSPILRPSKRSKYCEENNNFGSTITQSGPSISSVEEWFKRNEPAYRASPNLSIKENLKNVLEKLDTTLVEIHHNTSKRFINMFVRASTQLSELRAERARLQRVAAADIMAAVVSLVDDKFMQLNERLQSLDEQFMESLKARAHEVIREECKQKRAMVRLLRADAQAVLDHMEARTAGDR